MNARAALRALLDELDGDGSLTVPTAWLRELLDDSSEPDGEALVDLTVPEVARLFDRAETTVREWLQAGRLRGYKLGREWRVPRSAIREFQDAAAAAGSSGTEDSAPVDLGRWRREG